MNKKAIIQTESMIWYLIFIIAIGALSLFLMIFTQYQATHKTNIPNGVKTELLQDRILTPQCMGNEEHHNTIELQKFTEKRLKKCYPGQEKNFKIKIGYSNQGEEYTNTIQTQNWNPRKYSTPRKQKVNLIKNQNIIPNTTLKIRIQ